MRIRKQSMASGLLYTDRAYQTRASGRNFWKFLLGKKPGNSWMVSGLGLYEASVSIGRSGSTYRAQVMLGVGAEHVTDPTDKIQAEKNRASVGRCAPSLDTRTRLRRGDGDPRFQNFTLLSSFIELY